MTAQTDRLNTASTPPQHRLNTALDGRYRILRHLGEGGMATVHLCEDLKHDRQVARKLLKPELAAVLGAERFVQEIKTTAALQHPHVLPLFLDELVAVPIAVRRTRIDARFCAAPTRCEGIRELLATQS